MKKNKASESLLKIDNKISELTADKTKQLIEDHVKTLSDTTDGLNAPSMWKLKKNFVSMAKIPPQ